MEMGGYRQAPAVLPQGMTLNPLYRGLCGSQERSEWVRKTSSSPGWNSRTVQPLARHYTV
jgi:hypothetical protein